MAKYQIRSQRGEYITDPCVVFRAQDRYAPYMLLTYINFVKERPGIEAKYIKELDELYVEMVKWQTLNPDKVKTPD